MELVVFLFRVHPWREGEEEKTQVRRGGGTTEERWLVLNQRVRAITTCRTLGHVQGVKHKQ